MNNNVEIVNILENAIIACTDEDAVVLLEKAKNIISEYKEVKIKYSNSFCPLCTSSVNATSYYCFNCGCKFIRE